MLRRNGHIPPQRLGSSDINRFLGTLFRVREAYILHVDESLRMTKYIVRRGVCEYPQPGRVLG